MLGRREDETPAMWPWPGIVPGSSVIKVRKVPRMSSRPEPGWDYRVLRDLLTNERLESYFRAPGDDLDRAFHLYEWNMQASAGVLLTTGMVEIIVRNAFDAQLRGWAHDRQPGRPWFDLAPLDVHGQSDVAKARVRATTRGRHPEVHGKVIAELTFGFWRYLAASRYLTSLWVPAMHAAFPQGPADLRTRRREVERHLQQLMFVRNRAAHHEPIHHRDLRGDLDAATQLTGWISPDAASWVAAKSPLLQLIDSRPSTA